MAILHRATIRPTKPEVLAGLLGAPVDILGAYRFDDPEGAVGVEGFVLAVEGRLRHRVLTYRDAPLDGLEPVATMEHSVLGSRWVYRGEDDAVALACIERALGGSQAQAAEEVYDGDVLVQTREPVVRIEVVDAGAAHGGVRLLDVITDEAEAAPGPRLRAAWPGGSGVIATAS